MHLVLVGPMGVGKSTVARLLAEHLGRPLRDSDDDLAAERGIRGRELVRAEGVGSLHRWEAEHLLRALSAREPTVVAAAASVVDDHRCVDALAHQDVAWLRASAPVLMARMRAGDHRRELETDLEAALLALARARRDRYAAVADVTVDTGEADPESLAEVIVAALG